MRFIYVRVFLLARVTLTPHLLYIFSDVSYDESVIPVDIV